MGKVKYFFLFFLFTVGNVYAQVGIGTTSPAQDAILELSSPNKALVLPRVQSIFSITNPEPGMMVFDIASGCIRAFTETGWGKCFSGKAPNDLPPGSTNCSGPTILNEVTNPTTGRIWMDRNLGAQQVASSSNDIAAYGDLFQWGRFSDGHQCRNSDTTSAVATSERPANALFIMTNAAPNNWLNYRNDTLWGPQNNAQNNPCPYGFRLPTEAEFLSEIASWTSTDTAGAITSVLNLPASGRRNRGNGTLAFEGSQGFYWTLDISGNEARVLRIGQLDAVVENLTRSTGASVRCIKVNF